MKIVIELEDAYIRRLVSEQIGQHISSLSKEVIETRIVEVLGHMKDRIDKKIDSHTEQAVKASVENRVKSAMQYIRVEDMAVRAVREMVKEKLK